MSLRDDRLLLHFECLVALAETQHFGKAAQRIGLSQPAFSQAIKALEIACGTVIIKRLRRFSGLTPEGEAILRHARRVTDEVQKFRLTLAQYDSGEGSTIRLGSVPSTLVTATLMTQELHKSYSHLNIAVQVARASVLHSLVQADQLAAAVCYVCPQRQEDLLVTTLYREQYDLVVPCKWADDLPAIVEWRDVGDIPLGLLESGYQFRSIIEDSFQAAGARPNVMVESNSMTALLTQAAMESCAVIMPRTIVQAMPVLANVRVIPLREPKTSYSVGLIVNRNRSESAFGQAILAIGDLLKSRLENAPLGEALAQALRSAEVVVEEPAKGN